MKKIQSVEDSPRRGRPARTPEERENELIALAMDRAEKQLRDGSASPSVICHYLKLGTEERRIEQRILEKQEELIKAKTEALQSQKRVEELYAKALKAMKGYSGQSDEEDDYYGED